MNLPCSLLISDPFALVCPFIQVLKRKYFRTIDLSAEIDIGLRLQNTLPGNKSSFLLFCWHLRIPPAYLPANLLRRLLAPDSLALSTHPTSTKKKCLGHRFICWNRNHISALTTHPREQIILIAFLLAFTNPFGLPSHKPSPPFAGTWFLCLHLSIQILISILSAEIEMAFRLWIRAREQIFLIAFLLASTDPIGLPFHEPSSPLAVTWFLSFVPIQIQQRKGVSTIDLSAESTSHFGFWILARE